MCVYVFFHNMELQTQSFETKIDIFILKYYINLLKTLSVSSTVQQDLKTSCMRLPRVFYFQVPPVTDFQCPIPRGRVDPSRRFLHVHRNTPPVTCEHGY